MAELEIRREEEYNESGQRVGIIAALLAMLLALVTISSHRAHTAAVLAKSEANDQWSFYEAKRLKLHNIELGEELVGLLGSQKGEGARLLRKYHSEVTKYDAESKTIQVMAEGNDRRSTYEEARALRFDIGEGMLELGLVLCSLYFISRSAMFPTLALVSGAIGVCSAVLALFVSMS